MKYISAAPIFSVLTLFIMFFVAADDAVAKRYGIIIANASFDLKTIPPVPFADENVDAMRATFRDALKIPDENIRVYKDLTRSLMDLTFVSTVEGRSRLAGLLRPGDRDAEVFVYYVGHGARAMTPGASCASPPCGAAYLLGRDADPLALSRTAFSHDELVKNLAAERDRHFPDGRVTLFIEGCLCGETQNGPLIPSSMALPVPAPALLETRRTVGVAQFIAAGRDDVAHGDQNLGRSVFTHFLANALYGEADEDGDRTITPHELDAFLADRVADHTRDALGKTQRPDVSLPDAPLVLASLPEAPQVAPWNREALLQFELMLDLELDAPDGSPGDRESRLKRLEGLASRCDAIGCGRIVPDRVEALDAKIGRLSTTIQRCRDRSVLLPRYLDPALARHLDRLVDDQTRECGISRAFAACQASGNPESTACGCLLDPDGAGCGDAARAACAIAYDRAVAKASADRTFAPLDAFARAERTCPHAGAASIASGREAVCRAAFDGVSDPATFAARAAALPSCPQAARPVAPTPLPETPVAVAPLGDCRAEAARATADAPNAALAQLLTTTTCKDVNRSVSRIVRQRVMAAEDAAADARTEAERARAKATVEALQANFSEIFPGVLAGRLAATHARLSRPACGIAYRNAQATGRRGPLERFAIDRDDDCPDEVMAARAALASVSCGDAFATLNRNDPSALANFLRRHDHCPAQMGQVRQIQLALASACYDGAMQTVRFSRNETGLLAGERALSACRAAHGTIGAERVGAVRSEIGARRAVYNRPRTFVAVFEGLDFNGGDLPGYGRGVTAYNFDACARQCASVNGCRKFTFNTQANRCFLKSGGIVTPYPTARSGEIYKSRAEAERAGHNTNRGGSLTLENGIDFPGADYNHQGIRPVSHERCRAICQGDRNCRGYSYVPSSNWCWPKHYITGRTPRQGVISGEKTAGQSYGAAYVTELMR
ncbi:MAG: PAN/Apple domain-containing protein [Pseudomonadota bacterium]